MNDPQNTGPQNTGLGSNPRYANYARRHRRSPAEHLASDRERWPGGVMVGFTLWNQTRLAECAGKRPEFFYLGALTDHAGYDAWLTEWVDKQLAEEEATRKKIAGQVGPSVKPES